MKQTPEKWNARVTFCLVHSRRLQTLLPLKNNRPCLTQRRQPENVVFLFHNDADSPAGRGILLFLEKNRSYSTQKVGVYKLPKCLPPAWMKQSGGLLSQPLAKNKEVTSHSPRHRDRQLGRSAAARGLRIFPEVVWEGVTRDDFTRPPACPLSSFFFFPGKISRHLPKVEWPQAGWNLTPAIRSPPLSHRGAKAGDWGGGGGEDGTGQGCPSNRVGGLFA